MIKRAILGELKSHLENKEISLIVGPRQAGKTTLMNALKAHLEARGKGCLFLSLDFESDQPFFKSQEALLSKIRLELGSQGGYVFIDEIQRKENAGVFLKGLYDQNLSYKLIVSGSGSLELKEKLHESLVGRKRLFEVGTISFAEFINHRTENKYEDRLLDFVALEKSRTKEFFLEYMRFGGYPRVVLEESIQEKRRVIDDIYRSYLERDIAYLLKVEKVEAFSSLLKLLAAQVGRMVNHTELSNTLGISLPTVQNYLMYAEKTFVIKRISPYFKNVRKEISKAPVVYFHDIGLRNYILGYWGQLPLGAEQGFLFQNFIFTLLQEKIRQQPARLHYWRTQDKAEVDFILDLGHDILPIEVKYQCMKRPTLGRSLRNFLSHYHPKKAWLINLDLETTLRCQKTHVEIKPYDRLLREQEPAAG